MRLPWIMWVCPNPMTGILMGRGGEGQENTEAMIRVVCLQPKNAKGGQQPLAARRDVWGSFVSQPPGRAPLDLGLLSFRTGAG